MVFLPGKQPRNLDASCKTDLDLGGCFSMTSRFLGLLEVGKKTLIVE